MKKGLHLIVFNVKGKKKNIWQKMIFYPDSSRWFNMAIEI